MVSPYASPVVPIVPPRESRRFDIVIVDSAPLLAVADTVPLLEHVDAVVIVARLGLSTRDSADRLKALLERVPRANIAGVVTNDVHSGGFRGESYSYYGYGRKAEPPKDRAELYRSLLDAAELTRE